ncbi:GSCFA domain-containing protein [Burkholderia cepacia]|uniref:GSCFA domain-containing protein n=1 Tax=Burkholderia cepacia TaxID=292 RepID=UPI001CF3B42C|nr:GSCFA domain-containing protein [Burkholderia cepacia]MCA7980252.1 GSCFA domain-containing protein [Burkholderia cepacia]
MKIAIVSNCQGDGLSKCLMAMNGTLDVEFVVITKLWDGSVQLGDLLRDYDLVLAQKMIEPHVAPEYAHKVHYFPSFAFPAFHPDMTYVRGTRPDGKVDTVYTPMIHYNSAIVLHGYLRGLSVDEIVASFRHETFSRLGYLDAWPAAKAAFLQEADEIGLPLSDRFDNWAKSGCFMYSFNHPSIDVIADVCADLLVKLGIEIHSRNAARYVVDDLRTMPVWPIYPEIAESLGLSGDYAFKRHDPHGTISLRQFVEESVASYAEFERDTLEPLNFRLDEYDRLLGFTATGERIDPQGVVKRAPGKGNPYRGLPDFHFWKRAVAEPAMQDVDPVSPPRFTVARKQKVATAGSCFAQHIARTLSANGFNYLVSETAPPELDAAQAHARNFGVFSARYGNVYTARQLLQLIQRVNGNFVPAEQHWVRDDGRLVDPFRPQIEPEGFADLDALTRSRDVHFAAVKAMFEQMDVFVFTLGLTEGWRSREDGAVYPLAPGVAGGSMDPERYEFVNFTAGEVVADVQASLDLLRAINPAAKVILTVSPVPLIATFEPRHVLTSTTYSKSVLRVAADEIRAANAHVEYFPSYEIITGAFTRGAYFEDDLRSVKEAGVAHVMRLFLTHYMTSDEAASGAAARAHRELASIVCDEEAIANFQAG